jgi:hypothetical protein
MCELWIGQGGHYFVDAIQVGQSFEETDGSWTVDFGTGYLSASDLEAAKRLFVENYDRPRVQLSPGNDGEEDLSEGFSVIDLTPLEDSVHDKLKEDQRAFGANLSVLIFIIDGEVMGLGGAGEAAYGKNPSGIW